MLKKLLNFLFPEKCIDCHELGSLLCTQCHRKLRKSHIALRKPHKIVLYSYKNPVVKKALWHLKYKGGKKVAKLFAKDMESVLIERNYRSESKFILIPIPLTPLQKFRRGYNQAELIAQSLSELAPKRFQLHDDILYKKWGRKRQTKTRSREERLENMKDAFFIVNGMRLKNEYIIVIDDVTTTGATLYEAYNKLSKAGAKKILLCAIAS